MNWDYVNYLAKPYVENPSKKIVNVNLTEDEDGIITLVIQFAPKIQSAPLQTTTYAEGRIH